MMIAVNEWMNFSLLKIVQNNLHNDDDDGHFWISFFSWSLKNLVMMIRIETKKWNWYTITSNDLYKLNSIQCFAFVLFFVLLFMMMMDNHSIYFMINDFCFFFDYKSKQNNKKKPNKMCVKLIDINNKPKWAIIINIYIKIHPKDCEKKGQRWPKIINKSNCHWIIE